MTPALVLVSGSAGSGKSTLARLIARTYRLPCLDYDSLGQPFLSEIRRRYCPDTPCENFYPDWREQSYAALWGAAADSLRAGVSLVASAPCSREWRDEHCFSDLVRRYGADFQAVSVELLPDPERLKEQLLSRREARDKGKLTNWEKYRKNLPAPAVWDAHRRIILREYPRDALPDAAREMLEAALREAEWNI